MKTLLVVALFLIGCGRASSTDMRARWVEHQRMSCTEHGGHDRDEWLSVSIISSDFFHICKDGTEVLIR